MTSSNATPTQKKKKGVIPNPLPYMEQAREIMGRDFFGIAEMEKHFMEWATRQFEVSPEGLWLTHLAQMRTPEGRVIPLAEMEKCKNTHILVAVIPMSIHTILSSVEDVLSYSFEDLQHDAEEAFTKSTGGVGWYLVRKASVKSALGKMWHDQQVLLSKRERTEWARVMIYTIVAYFLMTGKLLFKNRQVRCLDRLQNGQRVSVGCDAKRLVIKYWNDNHSDKTLGLSAANK